MKKKGSGQYGRMDHESGRCIAAEVWDSDGERDSRSLRKGEKRFIRRKRFEHPSALSQLTSKHYKGGCHA